MTKLLGIAGFVFLLAVIWCMRTMKRGFTPLSANKERWREQFKEEERRLSKEQKEVSTDDQNRMLIAAVRDLIRLDGRSDIDMTVERGTITVTAPENTWILSFRGNDQVLQSTHKVLHSPGAWNLTSGGLSHEFRSVDELMQTFHRELMGEQLEFQEESLIGERLRHTRRPSRPQ
ncbi:MAG: hypothetical protein K5657_07255 [Desulfovibrio sp.]|nr:hypothetical protein [Desulfovibrio sp.]